MQIQSVLRDFVPVLGLGIAGYLLARFTEATAASLRAVVRYAMFPALLFTLLANRMEPITFATIAGIGAAMAAVGLLFVRWAPAVLKPKVDEAAAIPNIATFILPFLAIGWMSVGMGTAASLFVGVGLVALVYQGRHDPVRTIVGEPWLYAVVAALLFHALELPTTSVSHALSALVTPCVSMLFLFLGASMHPLTSISDAGAWTTVAVRLVVGVTVATVAIVFLPMSREVKEALILVAFAPPATASLALTGHHRSKDKGRDVGQRAAALGTIIALVAMLSLELIRW
jgi:predicted permease